MVAGAEVKERTISYLVRLDGVCDDRFVVGGLEELSHQPFHAAPRLVLLRLLVLLLVLVLLLMLSKPSRGRVLALRVVRSEESDTGLIWLHRGHGSMYRSIDWVS